MLYYECTEKCFDLFDSEGERRNCTPSKLEISFYKSKFWGFKFVRISGEKYIQEMFKNCSTPNSSSLCVRIVHIICVLYKRKVPKIHS
jgi:hypothetical protein